jgi:tRNA (adenine57-N1/adenine58-N1)-methyltransferase
MQLKDTVEALQRRPDFGEIDSFETLMRHWRVKGMSVRPQHRMVAHSAFIIVARRLANVPPASAVEAAASNLPDDNGELEEDSDGADDHAED